MSTIFTVRPQDLGYLDPEGAVDFFRKLLWAEASATGVSKNFIDVPSRIHVADGGIDAEVTVSAVQGGQGVIAPGLTRYQVKSGEFKKQDSYLKGLLCKPDSNDLKTRIKSCLDKKGRLVFVFFGYDNPDNKDDDCKNHIREFLGKTDEAYKTAGIEIWRQNTICGFLTAYPSLSLEILGRDRMEFQTHRSWDAQQDMDLPLVPSHGQTIRIEAVRSEIRRSGGPLHVRLSGEPGIGKTRIVLEAVRVDDLAPLVIYCDGPTKLENGVLMNELMRDDNRFHTILIVDDCPHENASSLWNKLASRGPRIKLVTIYSEKLVTAGQTRFFASPYLGRAEISRIIQSYRVNSSVADQWASLCGGFARVAHVVGANLLRNPGDMTRPPDFVNVWGRFIAGGESLTPEQIEERQVVLGCLSLFKRFGFSPRYQSHIDALVNLIRQFSPTTSGPKVHEVIASLRKRKILQGEFVLEMTPKLLQIHLWEQWWERHSTWYNYTNFVAALPDDLAEWHRATFEYARHSGKTGEVVNRILGVAGEFKDIDSLNHDRNADFVFALSKADPKSALECLRRILGDSNRETLIKLGVGRRYVVWALERIAVKRDLFLDAARLLLLLAEAENESVTNNATGVFAGLFSPGAGRHAPSEAPPLERIPVLSESLRAESKLKRTVGFKACEAALETDSIPSHYTEDYQGLVDPPSLWIPADGGDYSDYYEAVWKLLSETLGNLDKAERTGAIVILLGAARGVSRIASLTELVWATIEDIAKRSLVDKSLLIQTVSEKLHYDGAGMTEDARARWQKLQEELVGQGFAAKLRRFVGMDLVEDHYDSERHYSDNTQGPILQLAKQCVKDHSLLSDEYEWLMSEKAIRSFQFGLELGYLDTSLSLLGELKKYQKEKGQTAAMLGGYFDGMRRRSSEEWEAQLDSLCGDAVLSVLVPEITWRSGMSDRAAERILKLADNGVIDCSQFERFEYGALTRDISEAIFLRWLEYLLSQDDFRSVATALTLCHGFFLHPRPARPLPKEMSIRILCHSKLFRIPDKSRSSPLLDDYWEWVAEEFVKQYPADSLQLAELMLAHFGQKKTVIAGYHSNSHKVLSDIARPLPAEVWLIVAKNMTDIHTSKAFAISDWLRGGEFHQAQNGAICLFDLNHVWKWIDEDKANRAPHAAGFVPPRLFRDPAQICVARELLIRYGDLEDVRDALHANFGTESFVGSGSLHYKTKRDQFSVLKEAEDNQNVLRWLDDEITSLDASIREHRIFEESRGF